jgi:hypothetical protein
MRLTVLNQAMDLPQPIVSLRRVFNHQGVSGKAIQ